MTKTSLRRIYGRSGSGDAQAAAIRLPHLLQRAALLAALRLLELGGHVDLRVPRDINHIGHNVPRSVAE